MPVIGDVRTQNMKKILLRTILAIIVFIVVGILGTLFVEEACFPVYAHGSDSLGCSFALFTPIYASVAAGIITGWHNNYNSVLLVVVATSVGLALLFRGFFTHWYGSDFQNTIRFIMLWNLIPAIITTSIISSYHIYNKR